MVKRRDLNQSPAQSMAEIVRQLREQAQSSKTGAHGVKDLGENGDVVWGDVDAEGQPVYRSVKRFSVELDDTTERQEQLETDLEGSLERIGTAEESLTTLREVTLPAVREALEEADADASEALQGALDRIGGAESAITEAQDDLTSLRALLDNTDLADLEQRLAAALADIEHFQTVTMPALDQRLEDAEAVLAELEDIDIADLTLRLSASEVGLSELRETTLPGLQSALEDRIASTESELRQELSEAGGAIGDARQDLDAALGRLDEQDAAQAEQAARMVELAKQAQRGPLPEPDSPLGAHWVSPQGHMYVRVECEEVA